MVTIRRHDNHGFGFTLRHFIVYPPETTGTNVSNIEIGNSWIISNLNLFNLQDPGTNLGGFQLTEPMDTVFVKEVRPGGPAHVAGLKTGDRLLSVNGLSVNGMQYAHVVSIIQQIPAVLTLQVVPKECDILQTVSLKDFHRKPSFNPGISLVF